MNTIGDMIIGVMLTSALLISLGLFAVDFSRQYGMSIDKDETYFTDTFNVFDDIYDDMEDINEKIAQQETDSENIWDSVVLYKDTVVTLSKIPNLLQKIVYESLLLGGGVLGLPVWVTNMVIFGITISVTLMLLSALMKWRLM